MMATRDGWRRIRAVLAEYRAFALRANAIDLAIGVALGAAFTAVVTAIVQGFFTPLIAAVAGQSDFTTLYFTLNGSRFQYGLVVNAIVTFLVVATLLFFVVLRPINSLRRRLGLDSASNYLKSPCPACRTEIVISARRCPACTEVLEPDWAGPVSGDQ